MRSFENSPSENTRERIEYTPADLRIILTPDVIVTSDKDYPNIDGDGWTDC